MTHTHVEGRRAIVILLALMLALVMVAVTAPVAEAAPDPIESYDVDFDLETCETDVVVMLSQKGKQAFDVLFTIYNSEVKTSANRVTGRSLYPNDLFPEKASTVTYNIPSGTFDSTGDDYWWTLRVTRNKGNWNDGDPTNGFDEFDATMRVGMFSCHETP